MPNQLTPALDTAFVKYQKRPTLTDIVKDILHNGQEGLKRAERLAFRFQAYGLTNPPPAELKQLREYIALLFKKPQDQLTSEENLVLGLYYLVDIEKPLDLKPGTKKYLSWAMKGRCLRAAKYFRMSSRTTSDSYQAGFAFYWLAYLYSGSIPFVFNDLNYKKELEIKYRIKARERGIIALLPKDREVFHLSVAEHKHTEFLRKAIVAQCPIALYECGNLLLKTDKLASGWIYDSLAQGYDHAALLLARQFETEGNLEVAILFYRALAENVVAAGVAQFQMMLDKINSFSAFVRYHICIALLHIEEESREYKRALHALVELLSYPSAVKELSCQIKKDAFEEDLKNCNPKVASVLRERWHETDAKSVSYCELEHAVTQGDVVIASSLWAKLPVTFQQKNELLLKAMQGMLNLIKTHSTDKNPDRYVEMVVWLVKEGAGNKPVNLAMDEVKEAKTESPFIKFFAELEGLEFTGTHNPVSIRALASLITHMSAWVKDFLKVDELYVVILSCVKLYKKFNELPGCFPLCDSIEKMLDLVSILRETPDEKFPTQNLAVRMSDEIQKTCGSKVFAMVKSIFEKKDSPVSKTLTASKATPIPTSVSVVSVPKARKQPPSPLFSFNNPIATPKPEASCGSAGTGSVTGLFGKEGKNEKKIDTTSSTSLHVPGSARRSTNYYFKLDKRHDKFLEKRQGYTKETMDARIEEANNTYATILKAIQQNKPDDVRAALGKHIFLRDLNLLLAYAKDKPCTEIQKILEEALNEKALSIVCLLGKTPKSSDKDNTSVARKFP